RAGERLDTAALRLPRERQREPGELCERRDVAVAEFSPLQARDPCDEGQMVGVVAFLVAALPVPARVALLDGLGDWEGQLGKRLGERGFEPGLYPPVVREEVVDTEGVRAEAVRRRDDVHPLREDALHVLEQLRVQAELQDGAAARLAGE